MPVEMNNCSAVAEDSYSQHGEDVLLAKIVAGVKAGVCLEVGAHDGISLSNTFLFEKRGWSCVLVEPNPLLCEAIRKNRTAKLFECAASDKCGTTTLYLGVGADVLSTIESGGFARDRVEREAEEIRCVGVQTLTLDVIVAESGYNRFDFISIDVEGHEASVLRGFELGRWKPKILIVENNSEIENEDVKVLTSKGGYRRVFRTGCNDWYAHRQDSEVNGFIKVLMISGDPLAGRHIKMIAKAKLPRILLPLVRHLWRSAAKVFVR